VIIKLIEEEKGSYLFSDADIIFLNPDVTLPRQEIYVYWIPTAENEQKFIIYYTNNSSRGNYIGYSEI